MGHVQEHDSRDLGTITFHLICYMPRLVEKMETCKQNIFGKSQN